MPAHARVPRHQLIAAIVSTTQLTSKSVRSERREESGSRRGGSPPMGQVTGDEAAPQGPPMEVVKSPRPQVAEDLTSCAVLVLAHDRSQVQRCMGATSHHPIRRGRHRFLKYQTDKMVHFRLAVPVFITPPSRSAHRPWSSAPGLPPQSARAFAIRGALCHFRQCVSFSPNS